ncbi:uncharacterized protein rrp8 isoform 1-T1 [Menidia menidia]
MFNEDEDWNDAHEVLEKSGPENTPKAKSSPNVKSKVVGKKSLLRTLQTLGSVPDWESNSRQQDSDSEAEAAPAHKKRKKRRKRRKQAEKSEEQEENVDSGVKEDAAGPKKKKRGNKFAKGAPNSNGVDAGKQKNEENPASEQVDAQIPANTDKISRQQWKNKMKNKRKSKNKYRQSEAVEDVDKEKDDKQESKGEIKPESQSKNTSESNSLRALQKKKMERQCKPKMKQPEEEAPVPEARQQKAQKPQKSVKAGKREHEPPADGSEQKSAQLQQELPDNQPQLPPKRFELSREQSLKRQKMQRMLLRREESPPEPPPGGEEQDPAPPGGEGEEPAAAPSRSDALRSRMEQRLEAARFRYINELLYSTSSGEARRMFQQDPQAFWVYHKGYTAQVQRWPANPVDAIISFIHKKPPSLVVADFGCGDCKIARSVKNKVHSFDLASTCELVTVCDMASVPLGDRSVDIAVFCLSLMGTNLVDFLTEANRVLKTGGFLKIAEVASRFENDRNFVSSLASLGFKLVSKDTENSHFYSFDFVKTGNAPKNVKKYGLQLKPCLYKKR